MGQPGFSKWYCHRYLRETVIATRVRQYTGVQAPQQASSRLLQTSAAISPTAGPQW